jgi:hypothetical protein
MYVYIYTVHTTSLTTNGACNEGRRIRNPEHEFLAHDADGGIPTSCTRPTYLLYAACFQTQCWP